MENSQCFIFGVMKNKDLIVHNYLYASPGTVGFEGPPTPIIRYRWVIGIVLSLIFHAGVYKLLIYQGFVSQFGGWEIVDRDYDVRWIKVNSNGEFILPSRADLAKLFAPKEIKTLEELEKERLKEEKRRAAQKARDEKLKQQKEKEKSGQDTSGQNEDGEPTEKDQTASSGQPGGEAGKPTGPPKFGQINSRPIREIVGKVYQKYKSGELQGVENAVFSVTVGFKINQDGSLSNLKVVKSSGSAQIDEAALNIIHAVGESRAMAPLASLSSMTITLNNGTDLSSLRVIGFAGTATEATELANSLNALLVLAAFAKQDRPEQGELLRRMQVKADGNRLVGSLSISRGTANSMMRKSFGNAATPPNS